MKLIEKMAEECIEGSYESELPPDCCVNPEITAALCKYLRMLYMAGWRACREAMLKVPRGTVIDLETFGEEKIE